MAVKMFIFLSRKLVKRIKVGWLNPKQTYGWIFTHKWRNIQRTASYEDIKYSFAISAQALGQIIPEICEALCKELKNEYFKVE